MSVYGERPALPEKPKLKPAKSVVFDANAAEPRTEFATQLDVATIMAMSQKIAQELGVSADTIYHDIIGLAKFLQAKSSTVDESTHLLQSGSQILSAKLVLCIN